MTAAEYAAFSPAPASIGAGSATVTYHDANLYAGGKVAHALVVFEAGDVTFTGADGADDTWAVPSGTLPYLIPVATVRVKATGTTVPAGKVKAIF